MTDRNHKAPPFDRMKKALEAEVNRALVNQTNDVLHLISDRMATALVVYTQEYVMPLEARIEWLETPLYKRAWWQVASRCRMAVDWVATRWDSAQVGGLGA